MRDVGMEDELASMIAPSSAQGLGGAEQSDGCGEPSERQGDPPQRGTLCPVCVCVCVCATGVCGWLVRCLMAPSWTTMALI